MELIFFYKREFLNQIDFKVHLSKEYNVDFLIETQINKNQKSTGKSILHITKLLITPPESILNVFSPVKIMSFVGENGCGKTSLILKLFNGINKPDLDEFYIYRVRNGEYKIKIGEGILYDKNLNPDVQLLENILEHNKEIIIEPLPIYFSNVFDGRPMHQTFPVEDDFKKVNISTNYFVQHHNGVQAYLNNQVSTSLTLFKETNKLLLEKLQLIVPTHVKVLFNFNYNTLTDDVLEKLEKYTLGRAFANDVNLKYYFIDWLLAIHYYNICGNVFEFLSQIPGFKQSPENEITHPDNWLNEFIWGTNNTHIHKDLIELRNSLRSLDAVDNAFDYGAIFNKETRKNISFTVNIGSEEQLSNFNELFETFNRLHDKVNHWNKPILNFEWFDSTTNTSLSSGEVAKLNLYSRVFRYTKGYNNWELYGKKNIILFIDEPDAYMHPKYQQEFISDLISMVNVFFPSETYNVQIILATHSPIILSDLTSLNYQKMNKSNGEVKFSSGDSTFAANIHSLYKDSFFLNDGLIGEFAKGKIKSLVDFFDEKDGAEEWSKTKAESFIQLIGEPVLKNALWDLFTDRFNEEEEETELEKLKRENEKLKTENELLKNGRQL